MPHVVTRALLALLLVAVSVPALHAQDVPAAKAGDCDLQAGASARAAAEGAGQGNGSIAGTPSLHEQARDLCGGVNGGDRHLAHSGSPALVPAGLALGASGVSRSPLRSQNIAPPVMLAAACAKHYGLRDASRGITCALQARGPGAPARPLRKVP